MSTFKVRNPWKTGKKKAERRGIRATDQRALKRRDKGRLRHEKIFLSGEERVFRKFP